MDPLNTDTVLIHRLSTAPSVSVLMGFDLVGHTSATFKLKILGVFSKNIHSRKFHFLFFYTKKVSAVIYTEGG